MCVNQYDLHRVSTSWLICNPISFSTNFYSIQSNLLNAHCFSFFFKLFKLLLFWWGGGEFYLMKC